MSSESLPKRREHFLAEFAQGCLPQPGEIQAQIERIRNSEAFVRSARMKRLLDFLVESVLSAQEDRLKESVIGAEVFDRPLDYDPKTDPIVRVEMRRLRGKLSEYYLSEGLGDPVLIWLDKGSYVPILAARSDANSRESTAVVALRFAGQAAEAIVADAPKAEVAPVGESPSIANKRSPNYGRIRFAVVALAAVLGGVGVYLHFFNRSSSPSRSSRIIPLTGNAGLELSPAFSPDGKQVAYSWDGNRQNLDIYVKPIDGGPPRRLTDNAAHDIHPAWSPDGKRIAFLRILPNESQVVVMPASGGIETVISRNAPSLTWWHPDQPEAASASGPVWPPDASFLVVAGCSSKSATCGLIKAYLDGRQELLSKPPAGARDFAPAVSPSGRTIAFIRAWSSSSADILVMPIEGGKPVRVTSEGRNIQGLIWLDENNLVYSSNQEGNFRFWEVGRTGGKPQPIPVAASRPQWPVFSPDGHWLAFVELANDANVWKLPLESAPDAGQAQPFLSSAGTDNSPAFSPHSGRIVFVSNRTGTPQLWLADSDGTEVRQLTNFAGSSVGTPRWSPDERRIVFDAFLNGKSAIWLVDSGGGNLHRLNDSTVREYMPSWSHDGQWVYYVSLHDGRDQLWKQRPDTGEKIQITDTVFFDAVEYPPAGLIYAERLRAGIWQIPVNGGKPMPVPELVGLTPLRYWTLANDKLYFVRQEKAPRELDELDLKTHHIRKVFNVPGELLAGTPGLAVDPTSRTLLFVQKNQNHSNILLQER